MKLSDYIRKLTPYQRYQYAEKAETTVGTLYQIAGGHKKAGGMFAKRLAAASGGFVSVQELRPDLFGDMQPIPEVDGVAMTQKKFKKNNEDGVALL